MQVFHPKFNQTGKLKEQQAKQGGAAFPIAAVPTNVHNFLFDSYMAQLLLHTLTRKGPLSTSRHGVNI
jgi:hypothetical protein